MQLRTSTKYIIVHHSASPRTATLEDIRHWHRQKDYQDIGYHFVIEGNGYCRKGRDIHSMGAHTMGCNEHSIGICVVGNNVKDGDHWCQEQIASLRNLIVSIKAVFGDGLEVYGHREAPGGVTKTECPGVNVRALL